MSLKIRVIEKNAGHCLFECAPSEAELAYIKAAEFEEMGLDVVVEHPTVNQTLAASLGVEGLPYEAFQESLAEEIEEHPGGCCASDKSLKH